MTPPTSAEPKPLSTLDSEPAAAARPRRTPVPGTPELLAPAGDFDAMRAAVANGADAVYFGLSKFNARHRAANFTLEELPATMKFLRDHNVKGFVTFNTLIFTGELAEAAQFIQHIAAAGVDAVIVQDLGVVRLIRALAPELEIHASTQMTLSEPRGIDFVRSLGVRRAVVARELSVDEIRRIVSTSDMPLEVFIHGALCVSYSGQCLTSESLGGRSANRGQCAQACRLPYDLIVDGNPHDLGDVSYLVSPLDLAGHDLVADLASLGVASLKIEGRLKSAHYVAATTTTYRAAIDAAAKSRPFRITPEQQADLQQSFSRGFSHGFLSGVNHQALVPGLFPKARGIRVGTVASATDTEIAVTIDNPALRALGPAAIKPGDGVVFDEGHPDQDEQGGRVYESRLDTRAQLLRLRFGHGVISAHAISPGAIVWKTDDPAMKRRLEQSWSRDIIPRRAPVDFTIAAPIGGPLTITAAANTLTATATWPGPVQRAAKHPATLESLREQLDRLGDSPFALGNITAAAGGLDGPMIPKSVLNDLRRQVVESLIAQRDARASRPVVATDVLADFRTDIASRKPEPIAAPQLFVLVRTDEQLAAVLDWRGPAGVERPAMVYADFEDPRRGKPAVDAAKAAGVPIALATVRVIKPQEEGFLNLVASFAPDAILVRNLGGIDFYSRKFPAIPLIGDYSLNVANELTADLFRSLGLRRLVPSYDLNWKQMQAMLDLFGGAFFETVVHQHMPMFHMEHCVFSHTLSDGTDYRTCGRPCEKHAVSLRDRVGMDHPLVADAGCRNTLFNATAQSAAAFIPRMLAAGVRAYRVELLRENAEDTRALLDRYAAVIAGQDDGGSTAKSLKILPQLGVTRGTLDFE